MVVKPGLKQTQVGDIPEEWEVRPLDSVAERIMVGIASAATHAYRPRGVPMFRNQNIKAGRLDDSDLLYVDPQYEATFKNKRLRAGDLLTMRTGYPGVTAVVPPQYESAQSFTTLITRPNQQRVESLYLCHYINSEYGQRFFTHGQIGGAQKNVNAGTLKGMPVPLPGLAEQRAIASALGDVDALLASLDKLIAKKRDLKQAAMQQLLTGQTRLQGFDQSGRKRQTEAGVIPRDWALTSLGELFMFKNGLNKAKEFFGHGTPIVNYMDVYRASAIQSDNLVGRVAVTKQELKHFDVQCGDVFFTRTSETVDEIGAAAVVLGDPVDTVFSGFLLRGRPKGDTLGDEFKRYCFASRLVRQAIISKCSYTTRALTNGRLLSAVLMPLPPLNEQAAIANALADMDAEIAVLEARREKWRAIKQGMMQELLTGRTRLV